MPIPTDILGSFTRTDLFQALIVGAHDYTEAMRIFGVACQDRNVPITAQRDLLLDVHRNHSR